MDFLAFIVTFFDLARRQAQKYTDKKIRDVLSDESYLSKLVITQEQADYYAAHPTESDFNTIYLVKVASAAGPDKYNEYQRLGTGLDSTFEMTGDTSTDLTEYAKQDYVNKAVGVKANKASNATAGNVAVLTADGSVADGGSKPLSIEVNTSTLSITIK